MPLDGLSSQPPDLVVPIGSVGAPLTSVGRTFVEYRQNVSDRLGNRYDASYPRLRVWVNEGYLELASVVEMPMLQMSLSFDLVSPNRLVQLPINVKRIDEVSVEEDPLSTEPKAYDGQLEFMTVDSYRKKIDLKGKPTHYTRQGDRFAIWPYSDKNLTVVLDAYFLPQQLVADTDSNMLGVEWDGVVELLATKHALTFHREYDEAGQVQNLALAQIRSMKDFASEQKAMGVAAFRPLRRRCGSSGKRPGDY